MSRNTYNIRHAAACRRHALAYLGASGASPDGALADCLKWAKSRGISERAVRAGIQSAFEDALRRPSLIHRSSLEIRALYEDLDDFLAMCRGVHGEEPDLRLEADGRYGATVLVEVQS